MKGCITRGYIDIPIMIFRLTRVIVSTVAFNHVHVKKLRFSKQILANLNDTIKLINIYN